MRRVDPPSWRTQLEDAERDLRRAKLFAAWCVPVLVVACIAVLAIMFIPGR